jgi:hypothetical protein
VSIDIDMLMEMHAREESPEYKQKLWEVLQVAMSPSHGHGEETVQENYTPKA